MTENYEIINYVQDIEDVDTKLYERYHQKGGPFFNAWSQLYISMFLLVLVISAFFIAGFVLRHILKNKSSKTQKIYEETVGARAENRFLSWKNDLDNILNQK
ncbi:unnamed protein product [Bursaphelenchus okinawaensis]|uniref:Uncharacterized protein n=1 Tax=Bursaphelenchus okinawaensis TaxID=465554 RepID=A0A811K1V0_9BILA|nr:unnamed protein product [Bursaphelenchus okinawaensis]CAG9090284.1 unnamed protein product [Bursaphelenchus okinawaensis]